MAEHAAAHGHDGHHDGAHEPSHYIRIWAILLVLLIVSIFGPMLEIRIVTLLTAFGVAIVKAYLVIKHFMHLDVQPKIVLYALGACLSIMLVFYFGVAPDVMRHDGVNWVNHAAANAPHPDEHGEGHAAPAGDHNAEAGHAAPAEKTGNGGH